MSASTEKQTVHDWSSGELVEYEIESEEIAALPEATNDTPEPL